MNPSELFADSADHHYDYEEAFGVISERSWVDGDIETTDPTGARTDPRGPNDVADVIAHHIEFGDYAETEVWILGKLKDGRYFFINSSCDTTGWDCQAGGHGYVSTNLEKVESFGMTLEERVKLGRSSVPSSGETK